MQAIRAALRNQRGMILFASLAILSLLIAVGLGVIVSTQNDSKITANLRSETQSFYIAEAGLAWAKAELSRSAGNPPALSDTTLTFSDGSFSVTFLTPNRVSTLVARVAVRSNGLSRAASQVIQARLTKTYDLADGALSLRGNSRARFVGNGFLVSGLNHDPINGQVLPGGDKRYPGISVAAEVSVQELLGQLSVEQRANITGGNTDAEAISVGEFPTAGAIAKIAGGLCNDSHAVKQAVPADGALSASGVVWGSRTTPELRCIEGLPGQDDFVALSGSSSGAGILVVRNADVLLNGALRWDGLIVVTGENVAFKVTGGELKEIYGSVIVNESNPVIATGRWTLDLQGNLKLLYSRAALAQAAAVIPASLMDNYYSFLPASITQDYWRALTP